MPYGLYGGGGDPAVDEQTKQIMDLISSLEQAPPQPSPVQPKPPVPGWQQALLGGTPRNFIGSLGDAIASMASVRAGGGPQQVGAYALGQRQQQEAERQAMEDYQKRQEENAAAERMLRNQTRIGAYERAQTLEGQKEIAGMKAQAGSRFTPKEQAIDVGGVTHRLITWYDPQGTPVPTPHPTTGVVEFTHDLGEAGYASTIMPGNVIGPDNQPQAGILRIPKGGSGAPTVIPGPGGSRLEPVMPPGLVQSLGSAQGVVERIPEVMDAFNKADAAVRGGMLGSGMLDQFQNWAQGKAAQTSIGPIVAPPAVVDYFRSMRSVLFPYIKSISGAQFPEQELQRYESQFPLPGVGDPAQAEHAWKVLIGQMATDIRAKYGAAGRTAPGGMAPSAVSPAAVSPEEQEYRDYLKSLGVPENAETP